MTAGPNTYSNISTFVNTIFEDALAVARENNFISGLVLNFSGQGMALRKNQEYAAATIATIGETDDLSSQTFTPTALSTLTPAEVGAQFFITDQRMESDPFGAQADASLELGAAMAKKIQTDVLGDFTSLTGGTVGTSGGTIAWSNFFAARALLKAQNAPEPYYAVMHEYQWNTLAAASSVSASVAYDPAFADEVMRRYYVGTVAGVQIFTTCDITVSTNAYGAMFARPALALDTRRAPRLEPDRDPSKRGLELNMSAVYAHGVWRPKFGVALQFSATTPS